MGTRLLPITLFLALTARSQPSVSASLNELNQTIEASGKFDYQKLANSRADKIFPRQ